MRRRSPLTLRVALIRGVLSGISVWAALAALTVYTGPAPDVITGYSETPVDARP